jgi:RecA-family ATPase
MKELKRLALRLNIVILLVAHPRKEGGNDLDNDSVSGSSVVTDIADTVLTYSRNTTEDESFHSLIGITKNRLYGKLLVGKYRAKVRYSEVSKRVIGEGDDLNKVYGCFAKPQAYEAPPF